MSIVVSDIIFRNLSQLRRLHYKIERYNFLQPFDSYPNYLYVISKHIHQFQLQLLYNRIPPPLDFVNPLFTLVASLASLKAIIHLQIQQALIGLNQSLRQLNDMQLKEQQLRQCIIACRNEIEEEEKKYQNFIVTVSTFQKSIAQLI